MLWVGQRHKTRKDKEKKRNVTKASDGILNTGANIAIATYSNTISTYDTHEIWMACMLQADGSVQNKGRYKNLKYSIQVSKIKKRDKIKELLQRSGTILPPRGKQTLPTETWHSIEFKSELLEVKQFNLKNLGQNQVDIFVEALAFWDGSIGKSGEVRYSCTDWHNINELLCILPRLGYECKYNGYRKKTNKHKDLHTVTIRKKDRFRLRPIYDEHVSYYTGQVACVTVDTGFILVRDNGQTFVCGNCALEPHVCAFFSRDPGLLSLYSKSAPANDIYTFYASKTKQYGQLTQECGYDPFSPTREALKKFKTLYNKERQVSKRVCLGCNYGMSHGKLQRELNIAGFDISLMEAKLLHAAYWEAFAGIKVFEKELLRQWRDNGGWILGPRGEPITIPKPRTVWNEEERKYEIISYTKDIVNRFVQRGGHDVHMRFILHLNRLRMSSGLDMAPFHVDLHDSTTWQIRDDQVEAGLELFRQAATDLNNELNWDVLIKYEPSHGKTLADFLED
jgi:hypothetical protein